MKSQRRHELKENVLGQELGKGWQFVKQYGNYLAWGLLGVAVVGLLVVWGVKSKRDADQRVQARYYELTSANANVEPGAVIPGLIELTEQTRDRRIAGLAAVEVGNRHLDQLVAAGQGLPADQRQALAQEAVKYYRIALDRFADQTGVAANAHYGLAKLAETSGDFAMARTEYEATFASAPQGSPMRQTATDAMERVDRLQTPVRLAPGTQPASAPATGPATAAAPTL